MSSNNTDASNSSNVGDMLKWIVALVLAMAAVVGNLSYSEQPLVLRVIAVVVLVAAALFVVSTTIKGKNAIAFSKESRIEVRKVIWPTRQETTQTTFIVLAVSIVMALVLWGIDGIMVRLVALATGI